MLQSSHHGTLELITWEGRDSDGEDGIGWGACYEDEAADLKKTFETKFAGNLRDFYVDRPQAFRWTCCGLDGSEGVYGCDHHGDAKAALPCKCDYCRGGKPVPSKMYAQRVGSQQAKGLAIRQGPDPRLSFSVGMMPNW